jgi:hypothetical protein
MPPRPVTVLRVATVVSTTESDFSGFVLFPSDGLAGQMPPLASPQPNTKVQ